MELIGHHETGADTKNYEAQLEEAFAFYKKYGVDYVKTGYVNVLMDGKELHDSQYGVRHYRRVIETAARCGMMIDNHEPVMPTGIERTWPNLMTQEGVRGQEYNAWSPDGGNPPEHTTVVPFLRGLAGPMDYTQGAMRNASKQNYYPCDSEPMSQGTRCRQLALYVVLDSPLNMLCDSPTNYLREAECTEFIAAIPTVWDETRILGGRMGEYIVTARRSGDTWYVGAITDWTPRDVEVDLAPLGIGSTVEATIFRDGVNADRKASDYKRETIRIDAAEPLKIHLAPGGGFVAVLAPVR